MIIIFRGPPKLAILLCFRDRQTAHFTESFLQHKPGALHSEKLCGEGSPYKETGHPGLHSAKKKKKTFVQIYQLVEVTELQNAAAETRHTCYFAVPCP